MKMTPGCRELRAINRRDPPTEEHPTGRNSGRPKQNNCKVDKASKNFSTKENHRMKCPTVEPNKLPLTANHQETKECHTQVLRVSYHPLTTEGDNLNKK